MEKLITGNQAPDFSFTDHQGKNRKLSDYRGKKVVLYFYPKDNTPGCTAEACSLRDGYDALLEKGFEVIGVSPDSTKSHDGFRKKFDLPFNLVADENKTILESYGVWGKKKFMGKEYMGVIRTTFVIGENGEILKVIDQVNTKDHAGQVLKEMEN